MFPAHPILLVDDDADLQRSYAATFRHNGIDHLVQCTDSREVEGMLDRPFQAVLLDLNMPHVTGRDLLPVIVQRQPDVPVVVITGVDDVETAVTCMKSGAYDYLVKPVDEETLLATTRRAAEMHDMRCENERLKESLLSPEVRDPAAFEAIVTGDARMQALFRYIEAVSTTPQPILVTGETGTGKELVASAIHCASGCEGKFVPVNIAGLDDNVFADTLFGHVKGAYTGATEPRKGMIEQAAGGTLFLDEIGDLNQTAQVKLLRLVQEREYLPLGSDIAKRTDARIVVATNRDLQAMRRSGDFREDLFFRLRAHHVRVPPLRERLDDLALLLDHFLSKAAKSLGRKKPTPPPELLTLVRTYGFPGNVRELEAMVYNAVSTHTGGILSMESFKELMGDDVELPLSGNGDGDGNGDGLLLAGMASLPTIREMEDRLIVEAMQRTGGNQTMASQILGITRQTLNRRLKQERD